jgi:hypothetical protein
MRTKEQDGRASGDDWKTDDPSVVCHCPVQAVACPHVDPMRRSCQVGAGISLVCVEFMSKAHQLPYIQGRS